ncbi:hypothetical protein OGAPHI_002895 [Ogataea philodendri]|uniref:Uncharacterized protein n=1 Tax=Ogataea philodendri TaxID=1378263 RepID=A0A9P8T5Y5_9ASCO|nr:uncharacterized protein OGAPHI_002895 [Ogataea philodendri]KAH3667246.1 hypothetical protein OGAPHI_002895 [Ogataea philodendri]
MFPKEYRFIFSSESPASSKSRKSKSMLLKFGIKVISACSGPTLFGNLILFCPILHTEIKSPALYCRPNETELMFKFKSWAYSSARLLDEFPKKIKSL